MLVLWGIVELAGEAEAVMAGAGERTIAGIMADTVRDGVVTHLPAHPTKRAVAKSLWDARALVSDARDVAGTRSVSGVVFAGHHTKQFIKKAEHQLSVQQTYHRKEINGHDNPGPDTPDEVPIELAARHGFGRGSSVGPTAEIKQTL